MYQPGQKSRANRMRETQTASLFGINQNYGPLSLSFINFHSKNTRFLL